jgi:phage-related protein
MYVLHCFQKKSPSGIRTPLEDVRLVNQRLRAARIDYEERYGKD